MDDEMILDLFFMRSQQAIEAVSHKYGALLFHLAQNILGNPGDAEECVNDAHLAIWESIPPQRPLPLKPYVCKIVRNLALKRYRYRTAEKRSAGFDLAFSEIEECLGASEGPEEIQDLKELQAALNTFLKRLPHQDRILFMRRYWFGDSLAQISQRLDITENNASVRLFRLRQKLTKHLKKEGVIQ